MRAGKKNRRIRIEALSTSKSTYGSDSETWALQKEIWADAIPLRGDEKPGGNQITSEAYVDFRIDYIAGLSPKQHRVRYEGNVYDILGIAEAGGYREALVLTCRAQPTAGVGVPIAGSVQLASPPSPAEIIRGGTVHIVTPEDVTIVLVSYAEYAFTINALNNLKVSAGSLTLSILLNGVAITGLSNISVTTTAQNISATAGNAVTVGDRITMVIDDVAGGTSNLEFTMKATI